MAETTFQLKGHYFNGEFHQVPTTGLSAAEKFIERNCPADLSQTLWSLPLDYRHIDEVLDSAQNGFKYWRTLSSEERINYLKAFQVEVDKRKDELARVISLETGKPLWEAHTEVASVIGKVDVTIKDSLPRIAVKQYENIAPETNAQLHFKPIGPSLVIGPFNFPCHLANGQILSALISGNSIIFKPSEKTCYSGQLLIECFHQAGLPKGVINLVQGDGESARRMLQSKIVKGVFFTGSKEVGLKVLQSTYQDLSKLVSLELGGKNPAIIHSDAQFDHALQEILKGSFLTAGQRCTSTALVYIHASLADRFVEQLHQLAKKIIVDHPIDAEQEPFMGPLIDQRAIDEYLLYMGMAKREGLTEIMRGKALERKTQGHYVSPSIHFANSFDSKSHFLISEIFGPNCTIIPYKEIDEAISMANSTEYGLAASVFTKDQGIFEQCLRDIDAGLINLNRSTVGASAKLPFGGVKNSGNYRPAAVSTIDACVYQLASLQVGEQHVQEVSSIKGLDLNR